jgi:hypothetical protein
LRQLNLPEISPELRLRAALDTIMRLAAQTVESPNARVELMNAVLNSSMLKR